MESVPTMSAGRTPNPNPDLADSQPILPPHGRPSADCVSTRCLLLNRLNFAASVLPSRILYYLRDSWVDFPARVVDALRPCFADGRPVIDLRVGGARYLFDFTRMLQFEFESGNCRSIAWIDEQGKCFFPKEFSSQEFELNLGCELDVEVEIGMGIGGDGDVGVEFFGGKRKRDVNEGRKWEEEEEVSSYNKHDDSGSLKKPCLDLGNKSRKSEWGSVKLLKEGELANVQVRNFFLSAMRSVDPAVTVTKIHQYVQNGCMEKARYENFQRQLDIVKTARGVPNVVYAWHGASAESVACILAYGFGLPSNAIKQGGCGIGVYFSPAGLPHFR